MRSALLWIAVGVVSFVVFMPPVMATNVTECSRQNFTQCEDGVGSGVTSLDSLRVATVVPSGADDSEEPEGQASLSDRLRTRAAGDGITGWFFWGGYTYSDFESVTRAPYEARLHNFLIGADTLFTDQFLFGMFAGYESLDVDTTFNGGGQDVDGITAGPYLAYLFNDTFSADLTLGYTYLNTDQDRIHPADGTIVTADFRADRAFIALNFNAVYQLGDVMLGGRVGYQYAREEQNGYTEAGPANRVRTVLDRGLTLGQASIGADIAYGVGSFEPYAHGVYRYDVTVDDGASAGGLPGAFGNPVPTDPDEIQWGLGLRYFGSGGVTGQVEWATTVGRQLFDEDSITFLLRVEF